MLMTVSEAFTKFRSNLEPTKTERSDASRRQKTIRSQVEDGMGIADSFLTGSYARNTAVRPLKDVDIMMVFDDTERGYLRQHPQTVLDKVCEVLEPHYPGRVRAQARSVTVEFGIRVVNDISDRVVAVDVVPAFSEGAHYRIPDTHSGSWTRTNPKIHQKLATQSNLQLNGHWVPLVKMVKKANSHTGQTRSDDKPIKPNFLLEVMAHSLIIPPWTGPYPLEIRAFFASAADLIDNRWPDPARLGPDVTHRLHGSPSLLYEAKEWLASTVAACDLALRQARNNQIGAALNIWQQMFGPLFVKTKTP